MKATTKHISNKRIGKLILNNGGQVLPFREMDLPHRQSIIHYMAIDGEAWDFPVEADIQDIPDAIMQYMGHFLNQYGNTLFGFVMIPMQELTDSILADESIVENFRDRSFQQYHEWYISNNPHMPSHNTDCLWPVILSSFEDETFEDGWHRFHDYYRKGVKVVPCVFYPPEKRK